MSGIVEKYRNKTKKSSEFYEEAVQLIPGGITANAKFFGPYPIFMRNAKGSKLFDVDGNEYIDYCLGYGPLILGHGPLEVVGAIKNQLSNYGTSVLGAPNELEIIMAKKISSIYPSAKSVRFTNSGTEATLNLIRLARAYTQKPKIAKFEGHYHGWHDYAVVSVAPSLDAAGDGKAPASVPFGYVPKFILDNTIVLPFNDLESTEKLIRKSKEELAAVVLEPLARGYMVPEENFLRGLKEITEDENIPLIFDEVMTGFRLGLGGAQEYFGVIPDMVALGKVIGGGLPVGICAGREDILKLMSPIRTEESQRHLFHSGTYNANATVLAAGLATIEVLEKPGTYSYINELAEALRKGFRDIIEDLEVEAQVLGICSIFHILFTSRKIRNYRDVFTADTKKRHTLDLSLCNQGVFFPPNHCCFTSLAHTEEDVRKTLDSAEESLKKIKSNVREL